jgi:hypothetical protein
MKRKQLLQPPINRQQKKDSIKLDQMKENKQKKITT